jgi:type I restriction enzyme S subunit
MIMQDNEKKPALRFKGFTDPWEQRKLGEIAKEVVRNDPASDAPIMMITAGNGFIEQSDRYAFNNAGESLKKYILLERGELAYNHGASKLRPYGSCFALTTVEKARIPFVYHCFSVEKSNPEFLSIELNGANVENQLRKIVSSGARMDGLLNIAYSEYTEVTVQLPKKEEQDWIAKFFKHLDTLITLHQRKYEKLVNIKKSMLDKMFPPNGASVPEIRFKGFTDPWEQRKVREVTDRYDNLRIPVAASLRVAGTTPYYGANGIQDYVEGYTHDGEFILVAEDGANDLKNYPVKCVKGRIWVNNHAHVLQGKCACADNQFLAYAISQADIESLLVGGGRAKLNAETLMDIELLLPSKNEQIQIGHYLARLDHLITLHQRKLEKLQNIKKSCLEKMFV